MEGIPQISVQGTGSVNNLELSSIPDALFIIQSEFKKFERDRLAWSIERSELKVSLYLFIYAVVEHLLPPHVQSRVLALEEECQSSQPLKEFLLKRIKMLEFALKKERYDGC